VWDDPSNSLPEKILVKLSREKIQLCTVENNSALKDFDWSLIGDFSHTSSEEHLDFFRFEVLGQGAYSFECKDYTPFRDGFAAGKSIDDKKMQRKKNRASRGKKSRTNEGPVVEEGSAISASGTRGPQSPTSVMQTDRKDDAKETQRKRPAAGRCRPSHLTGTETEKHRAQEESQEQQAILKKEQADRRLSEVMEKVEEQEKLELERRKTEIFTKQQEKEKEISEAAFARAEVRAEIRAKNKQKKKAKGDKAKAKKQAKKTEVLLNQEVCIVSGLDGGGLVGGVGGS
jgi:hypothetical protein